MNTGRSDAATSTDDIKGRPLCLFYFAHPFGVLSCEPPTVLASAPAAEEPAPDPTDVSTMARRPPAAAWLAGPCSRRMPHTRTLPPLRLPTPRDLSSVDSSDDVWSRSSMVPPDKVSLPPIRLTSGAGPLPPLPAPPAAGAGRVRRSPRLGPAGVRKGASRSRPALARLLRRAVASGVGCAERSARGVRAALATMRAAWQPPRSARAGAGSEPRSSCSIPTRECAEQEYADCGRGGGSGSGEMRAHSPASPGLLHRRYSVPETIMRRYRLAREQSDAEGEEESRGVSASRELVRRSALLRRLGGGACRCRCDARSLDGSRAEVCVSSPEPAPPPVSAPDSLPVLPSGVSDVSGYVPSTSVDLLEIVVSETSPAARSHPIRTPVSRSTDFNLNIDEYVSNILVDSLNSLTDRLESMTVSVGGNGRISVVEKEIKVKLQNTGVNTVVHLSPTSNNQIIFGNEELCERETPPGPPQPVQKLFCANLPTDPTTCWRTPSRPASPCASLVDSLDDPASPRAPPPPRPLPSPVTLKDIDTETLPPKEKCKSFFIRMNDDDCACEKENIVVADHMPEKIKQRLYRRHRRREIRAQGVRRGAARRAAHRDVHRQCAALVDALIDDAVANIAREEYRFARIARRRDPPCSDDSAGRAGPCNGRAANCKIMTDYTRPCIESRRIGPFVSQPLPPPPRERGPRRLYHKSEIHDGGKCIEILEIVEYANTSRSSSETNSDESLTAIKGRKSRIPVPIQDKNETARTRRSSILLPETSAVVSTAPVTVVVSVPPRRASVPSAESRAASSSRRFERVFDAIPEERSSLSVESAGEETSAAPSRPAALPARRSAATSPHTLQGATSREGIGEQDGVGRRTVGTQWAPSPQGLACAANDLRARVNTTAGAGGGSGGRSSSECECEPPPPTRRRVRARRRTLRPVPPTAHPEPQNPPKNSTAADPGAESWSLTLAGSCAAALPARLDLRLRFPTRTARTAARHAPRSAQSPRNENASDAFSDNKSQETEWSSCGRPEARCAVVAAAEAPAIRYVGAGTVREPTSRGARRCARPSPAALPALTAPPRKESQMQLRCRRWSPASPERRAPAAPRPAPPARAARPAACDACPAADHAGSPHCTRCISAETAVDEASSGASAAGRLAVLGCAIVPERRAAPPTASQRDPRRLRALRARLAHAATR